MSSKRVWQFISLLLLVLTIGAPLAVWHWFTQREAGQIEAHAKIIEHYRQIDQQLYLALPIYQDYINAAKQKELRRYLLNDHLRVAERLQVTWIEDDSHMQSLVGQKKLIKLEQKFKSPYYFYNVSSKMRFLTPHTYEGLLELSRDFNRRVQSRFQKKFKNKAATDFVIKFAISSATRPGSYQQQLRGRNSNAALESSHSYGISFDIFYDEFYVFTDIPETNPAFPWANESKSALGFAIGRARRRQLRAMLAESLLELQAASRLYAIWERNQRCYHVTIL